MRVIQARELVEQLVELGRREREMITEGRLEDVATLAEERSKLASDLSRVLPAPPMIAEDLRELLQLLDREGRENLVLLQSLRDEMSRRIHDGRDEARAATSYEKNRTI